VIDGLTSLWLDAVVGCNDQDRDIGYASPPGTHGCEGLVTRRIQKGDALSFHLHLVRADVLGNAPDL